MKCEIVSPSLREHSLTLILPYSSDDRMGDYPYTEYSYSSSDLYTYTDSYSALVSAYGTTGARTASVLQPRSDASETLVAVPPPARSKRL